MDSHLDFDKDMYFGIVADNLLKNLGTDAFYYADEALKKMRAIGDDEGFDLWMSIQDHLISRVGQHMPQAANAVHLNCKNYIGRNSLSNQPHRSVQATPQGVAQSLFP